MKAVILAAGRGLRMKALTEKTPKALLKIKNKPLIYHLVSKFPKEVKELVIVVGYLGEKIKRYCGKKFLERKVNYVFQENLRGTYHGLFLSLPYLTKEEKFFVFYSDDLIDKETIQRLKKYQRAVIVQETKEPQKFGVVVLNKDGSIKEIVEKPENPQSHLVLTSGMILDQKIFQFPPPIPVKGEYYLSTAIGELAKFYKVMTVKAKFWFPIANPEDLEKAEKFLKSSFD